MIRPSVLIVEDEAIVAEDLAQKVTALGYLVIGMASSGEAALELAQAQRPHLILLDISLDGALDGIETANRLRNVCDLPVIFLTAHSDQDTVKRANAAGAFGYVLKPFREHDLEVQLDTALYRYRATKAKGYLDLAQKAGSVGFFDYHFEQDRSVWTEGLAQLFAISLKDHEGTWEAWTKRVVPEDAAAVRQLILESTQQRREQVSYEFRAILPDGKIRWLTERGQIVYATEGKPLRMTGVTIDITERKEAEQKLKKSEDLLLRAQRGAQAGVWEIDLRTDRMTWSEPYYDLFGLAHSIEPSVAAWLSCIHPEDREGALTTYRESIKEKRSQNMEFRIVKPNGDIRWIQRQGHVEVDEQGHALRLNGISFDVTERKHTDEVVKAIALFPAQNPSPVLRINGKGILLYMNPASTQVLGALNLKQGQPVPRDLSMLVDTALQANESRQAEYTLGAFHYLITTSPAVEDRYANLYWTDITERKHAEVELHDSREKLRHALEFDEAVMTNIGEGLYTVNNEGLVTSMNPAAEAMFGWASSELLGRKMHDMTHYKHRDGTPFPAEQCPGLQVLRQGSALKDQEDVFVRKDGSFFDVVYSSSPIRAGSKIDGLVVVFRDITERKRTEERLKQVTAELEQRVSERTHELVESEGRLRRLATELNLAEQRERKRLSIDLHDHLQQILVLGKLKLGQLKRQTASLPTCASMIAETDKALTEAISYTRTLVADLNPPVLRDHGLSAGLKWLEEYMRKYHLDVTVQIPNEELGIADDQALLLFQSVRELLINSSKYAETTRAWVNAKVDGAQLVIEVIDKGKGFTLASGGATKIPIEETSKFGHFSIRERMQALGGSFAITSSPGNGTTAVLRLPLPCMRLMHQ